MRYAIQVDTPYGLRFVGPVYRSKAVARSWVVSEKQARKMEAQQQEPQP